jgi:P4 family phage/plasmid primase-like protien
MSLFSSARSTTPLRTLTIDELVAMVREPSREIAARLASARRALAQGDSERFATLKRELPAVSIGGTFSTRGNKNLLASSGLMPIDLDHLTPEALAEAKAWLREDPRCAFCYTSPSGSGLKGAIRIDPHPADDAAHKAAFAAVRNYLRALYHLELDPACKDVARLAFLSHDPDCVHNPHAEPLLTALWADDVLESALLVGENPSSANHHPHPPVDPFVTPAPLGTSHPFDTLRTSHPGPAQDFNTSDIPHQTSHIPAASGGADPALLVFPDNDAGRGARFVDRWQDEIRYIPERGFWLVWEGRWVRDINGGITRRAVTFVNEVMAETVAGPATTPDELKRQGARLRYVQLWGNRKYLDPMLALARTHTSVQARVADLDADPWLLGTPNAVVDLRTGIARPHSPEHLITMTTRAAFDHTARAPRWERFIEEIYPDPALRRYAWKAWGYAITGHTGEKCFHFLTGIGNNGKSKECEAVEYVAGDYAGHAAKGLLCANDKGQYPLREAASIVGKRIIIGPETDAREWLNVSVIKTLTGHGDTMRAANLYENQFDFIPTGKLFIMGNHKPTINDTGTAIWNRVRLLPHDRIFGPDEQDKSLGDKLREEASGILNWLIEGCLLWQKEGLEPPDKVRAAVEQYRTEEDTLGEFIDDCTRIENDETTPHSELYIRYTEWARQFGFHRIVTKKTLAKMLREKGWAERRTNQSAVNWLGVTLAE